MSTPHYLTDAPGPFSERRRHHHPGRYRLDPRDDVVAFGPMQDEPGRPGEYSEPGQRGRRGRRGGPGEPGAPRGRRGPEGRRGPDAPWDGPRRRRRGQAGRGDVRVALLALLAESPMHGYQMIGELAERSGGVWRPSPGSVYPTLAQLEDEGLVSADESSGRRVFSLTDAGRAHLADAPAGPAPWVAMADSDRHRLHDLVRRLAVAVAQVDEAGTAEQRTRTAELIETTRKSVYRILAEDDSAS